MANNALTVIKILKGAPCDDTYSDVIKFGSAGAQAAYFSGLAKYTFSNCSYQRVNSSVASPRSPLTCRIPTVADNVYDCNYIMFQNKAFGSKWFYAFIRRMNYISPDCTEIEYEIDSYQTYQFDYTVKPSFVEREHWNHDELNASLAPDFAPSNDAVVIGSQIIKHPLSYIDVVSTTLEDGETPTGWIYNNLVSGCYIKEFPANASGIAQLNSYLAEFSNKGKLQNIVGLYQNIVQFDKAVETQEITLDQCLIAKGVSLGGYIPKNNKLYQAPYCYWQWGTTDGSINKILKPQAKKTLDAEGKMSQLKVKIKMIGGLPALYVCSVADFGLGEADSDYYYTIVAPPPPTPSWVLNNPANVAHQTLLTTIVGTLSSMTTSYCKTISSTVESYMGVLSGVPGKGLSEAASGFNSAAQGLIFTPVGSLVNYYANIQSTPLTVLNGISSPELCVAENKYGFQFALMAIPANELKTIDQYFDMFGYATNLLKIPNETGRDNWNYVKTSGVVINGSMPVQDMATIKAMYNRGVRFWHTTDVGNYSLSNDIKKEVVTDDVG